MSHSSFNLPVIVLASLDGGFIVKTVSFLLSIFRFQSLGYCALCMRIAFGAATLSWSVALGSHFLGTTAMATAASIVSILFTLLWLGHVIGRAIRSLRSAPTEVQAKRLTLQAFGRAALGAAAVSLGLVSVTQNAEAATCGEKCSKTNDKCATGCICWWELGKCVEVK